MGAYQTFLEAGISDTPTAVSLSQLESGIRFRNRNLIIRGGVLRASEAVEYWKTRRHVRTTDDLYIPLATDRSVAPRVFLRTPLRDGKPAVTPSPSEGIHGTRLTWLEIDGKVKNKLRDAYGAGVLDNAIIVDLARQSDGIGMAVFQLCLGIALVAGGCFEAVRPRFPRSYGIFLTKIHSVGQKVIWSIIGILVLSYFFVGSAAIFCAVLLGIPAIVVMFIFAYVRQYFPHEPSGRPLHLLQGQCPR